MKQTFLFLLPLAVFAFGCERHEPESQSSHGGHGSASHGSAPSSQPAVKEAPKKETAPAHSEPAPKFFDSKPTK